MNKLGEVITLAASSGALSAVEVAVLRELESDCKHLADLGYPTVLDAVIALKDQSSKLDTLVARIAPRCLRRDNRVGQGSGIVEYCGACGLNLVDNNLKHCPLPEPPK